MGKRFQTRFLFPFFHVTVHKKENRKATAPNQNRLPADMQKSRHGYTPLFTANQHIAAKISDNTPPMSKRNRTSSAKI